MRRTTIAAALMIAAATPAVANPAFERASPSFNSSLSNTFPLAFGMTPDEAELALGTPLQHVRGRAGEETFLAIRTIGGSGFFPRNDRLFIQFRRGRLTGFKGDWGDNWMWR